VYIRSIYPAIEQKSGKEKDEAGGFEYSLTPRGEIIGSVGTGFTKEKRRDMFGHPEDYIGMVARVKSPQQYSSGALRAPSFYTMDIEKNLSKVSCDSMVNNIYRTAFNEELEKISVLSKREMLLLKRYERQKAEQDRVKNIGIAKKILLKILLKKIKPQIT